MPIHPLVQRSRVLRSMRLDCPLCGGEKAEQMVLHGELVSSAQGPQEYEHVGAVLRGGEPVLYVCSEPAFPGLAGGAATYCLTVVVPGRDPPRIRAVGFNQAWGELDEFANAARLLATRWLGCSEHDDRPSRRPDAPSLVEEAKRKLAAAASVALELAPYAEDVAAFVKIIEVPQDIPFVLLSEGAILCGAQHVLEGSDMRIPGIDSPPPSVHEIAAVLVHLYWHFVSTLNPGTDAGGIDWAAVPPAE